jgi:hypothetical protein
VTDPTGTRITGYPLLPEPSSGDILLIVDTSEDATSKATVGSLPFLPASGGYGNYDGGSATTGEFPVETLDGGGA